MLSLQIVSFLLCHVCPLCVYVRNRNYYLNFLFESYFIYYKIWLLLNLKHVHVHLMTIICHNTKKYGKPERQGKNKLGVGQNQKVNLLRDVMSYIGDILLGLIKLFWEWESLAEWSTWCTIQRALKIQLNAASEIINGVILLLLVQNAHIVFLNVDTLAWQQIKLPLCSSSLQTKEQE